MQVYKSLAWGLNSPPKAHAFMSLSLQSSAYPFRFNFSYFIKNIVPIIAMPFFCKCCSSCFYCWYGISSTYGWTYWKALDYVITFYTGFVVTEGIATVLYIFSADNPVQAASEVATYSNFTSKGPHLSRQSLIYNTHIYVICR